MDNRQLTSSGAPLFGHLPPVYAAYFRGLVVALLLAALEAADHYLSITPLSGSVAVAVPVLVLVLRTVEGLVDQRSVATPVTAQLETPAES